MYEYTLKTVLQTHKQHFYLTVCIYFNYPVFYDFTVFYKMILKELLCVQSFKNIQVERLIDV